MKVPSWLCSWLRGQQHTSRSLNSSTVEAGIAPCAGSCAAASRAASWALPWPSWPRSQLAGMVGGPRSFVDFCLSFKTFVEHNFLLSFPEFPPNPSIQEIHQISLKNSSGYTVEIYANVAWHFMVFSEAFFFFLLFPLFFSDEAI